MLKPLLALFGAVFVIASFLVLGWQIGYLALILFLLWLVLQAPERLKRRLLLAYLVFVIALISSTAIDTAWVRSASVQRALRSVTVLHLLAGDTTRLAFWAIISGVILGIVIVWAGLQLLLFVSSEFVLNLTAGLKISRKQAMRYLLDLVLQRQSPSIVIDNGQIIAETPAGLVPRLGGPGLLVVRPGNAVVLETVSGASQITGSGTAAMGRFEQVRQIVDLRPQEEFVTIKDMLTKDRVPLAFQARVLFQIEPKGDTDVRSLALTETKHFDGVIAGMYPVYKESVFKAAYNVSKQGWQQETVHALTSALREAVFEYNLDELYDYPVTALSESRYIGVRSREKTLVISALEEAVQGKIASASLTWGVKVSRVEVVTVEMPVEIRQMVLTWWQKKWETEIAKQDASKEAKVMLERAAGRRDALIYESEGEAFARAEWLRQVLQVLLKENQQLDPKNVVELLVRLVAQEGVTGHVPGGQPGLPRPAQGGTAAESRNERPQQEQKPLDQQVKPPEETAPAKSSTGSAEKPVEEV